MPLDLELARHYTCTYMYVRLCSLWHDGVPTYLAAYHLKLQESHLGDCLGVSTLHLFSKIGACMGTYPWQKLAIVSETMVQPLGTTQQSYMYVYRTQRPWFEYQLDSENILVQQNVVYPNFNYPNMLVNQTPDMCCHAQCGHVALSDHYLFVCYNYRTLTERLNERTSICLTC